MKKKKKDIDIIPMKCIVCTECYRESNRNTLQCHYGGPYTGYVYVNDKK